MAVCTMIGHTTAILGQLAAVQLMQGFADGRSVALALRS
jgi:hypothetical protein